VAHASVSETEVDNTTVRRIYLGKKTRWDNRTKIIPVILKDESLHKVFVKEILNRSVSNFENYWKQAVFTGRGIPPRAFDSELDLLQYVSRTPGALGYVSRRTAYPGVKVLALE
jgi:ABC-type phosphate transport system substrate-binding protein